MLKDKVNKIKQSIETKSSQQSGNPCVKQTVSAVIMTEDGEMKAGNNNIQNMDVGSCPRVEKGCATGEGYDMCSSVCNQNAHAEVTAIKNMNQDNLPTKDSTLFLIGHTYCCDNCISEMRKAEIGQAHVIKDDNSILSYDFKTNKKNEYKSIDDAPESVKMDFLKYSELSNKKEKSQNTQKQKTNTQKL